MIQRLIRALFELPPRRCACFLERLWLPMPDGVRLATIHLWPVGRRTAPALLLRTPYGITRFPRVLLRVGRLIAEAGYHVILQDVRGRHESEGIFRPYVDEGEDGKSTLDWLASQSWCNGRIGMMGASYLAYTAWAALARAPERVSALVVGMGSRDLYSSFYPGGAFSLATALEWGTGIGEREQIARNQIDLERAFSHRPVREADRVALRRVDWFRDWIDHPRRDGYWDSLCPPLPENPPPTLQLAGWYDFFLGPQLDDHRALCDAARKSGSAEPRLVIGPWAHGRIAHRSWRGRRNHPLGVALREAIPFLDQQLGNLEAAEDHGTRSENRAREESESVRFYMLGEAQWKNTSAWPVPDCRSRVLYLRSGGRANAAQGDGRLSWDAPDEAEPADRFHHDPRHPVPSCGGALLGRAGGAADQRSVERRRDVLCYTGAPLEKEFAIAGPVRVVLYVASSAEDSDFSAKLVSLGSDGRALNLCEGITRCRWRDLPSEEKEPGWLQAGEVVRIEIDLWATACRFRRGHQIRIEISSSNFPRFDRNPQTRDNPSTAGLGADEAAEQSVFHEPSRLSHVLLPALPE